MLLSLAWPAGRKDKVDRTRPAPPFFSVSPLSESAIQVEALKWHLFNKLLAAGQYCYNEVVTRSGRKQMPGLVC